MKEIEQVVSRYLEEKDTDYAIMITGEWGCGKTYYVNKYLKDKIGAKKCFVGTKEECYKPLYLSLYGVSDVSDIKIRIIEELFPLLKYKFVWFARRGLSSFFNSKGIDRQTQREMSSFKGIPDNTVLIFDDIERLNDKKIDIKDVLGVINQYAEHDHLKVILICNDKKSDDAFYEFKEKTIRYSIKFQRSLSASFDIIISERINDDYTAFLNEQKGLILDVFEKGKCNNLRTILFAIDTFKEIYNKVKDSKYKKEILKTLLVSFLIYTIEYKSGKTPEELNELSKLRHYWNFSDNKNEKDLTYIDELYDKYSNIRYEYNHYPIIIEFITNGYLDNNALNAIINELNNECIKNAETPEGKLLKQFEDWRMIEDDQFIKCITELIQYVKDGKYSVRALTTLYHQLLVIEHFEIEGFKLDDNIDKVFRDSAYVREHQDGFNQYIEHDLYQITPKKYDVELDKRYDSYIKYIGEVNTTLREKGEKNIIDGFMSALRFGDSNKITEYGDGANFEFLLKSLDANEVFSILKDSDKSIVIAFLSGFYTRYPDRVSGFIISPQVVSFINDLKNLIKQHLEQLKVKKVSSIWYQILVRKLDDILNNAAKPLTIDN